MLRRHTTITHDQRRVASPCANRASSPAHSLLHAPLVPAPACSVPAVCTTLATGIGHWAPTHGAWPGSKYRPHVAGRHSVSRWSVPQRPPPSGVRRASFCAARGPATSSIARNAQCGLLSASLWRQTSRVIRTIRLPLFRRRPRPGVHLRAAVAVGDQRASPAAQTAARHRAGRNRGSGGSTARCCCAAAHLPLTTAGT